MRPSTATSRVPWLVGGLLVAVVVILATLQLRWLGQVEAADRQRLEAAVERAVAGLAADVDREVSRAWLTFLPDPHGDLGPETLAERWERWNETAPAPGLVRDVAVAEAPPSRLHPGREPGRRHGPPFVRLPELLPGLPGLEVPLDPTWSPWLRERQEGGRRVLRVVFDARYVEETLLPELVRRHLVPVLGDGVDVRVTVTETGALVYASAPDLGGDFDWQAPLFDLLPPDDLRRLAFGLGFGHRLLEESDRRQDERRGDEQARELPRRPRHLAALASLIDPPAGWTVEVRPAAGSLAAALTRARRGNAAVVFGLLALLGSAAVALALYARRAQEMARRQSEFTAAVSHELRTPIAAIRSLADNLADGLVREPEQARLYGEQIARQGARLTDMVEQVLALAAGDSVRGPRDPRPVEVAPVVRDAVAEVAAGAPGVAMEVDLPADLPPVTGDRQALERAVANLVGNAVKHGGDGVRVRARAAAEGREVEVAVSDRGPGIPAAERERLFEPFFRGQSARSRQLPGSGLGLHLVQRIAAAHGGRVEVDSTPGRGSTFTLVLPARAEPALAADPAPREGSR